VSHFVERRHAIPFTLNAEAALKAASRPATEATGGICVDDTPVTGSSLHFFEITICDFKLRLALEAKYQSGQRPPLPPAAVRPGTVTSARKRLVPINRS
jgi:hypothetical protein